MPVTATGPLATPFAEARDLLAATAEWQSVCSAANATEAAARIYLFDATPTNGAEDLVPFITLADFDGLQHRAERIRPGRGQLLAEFFLPLDDELSQSEQELDFRNKVGTILQQAFALAQTPKPGGGGYWHFVAFWKEITPQVITESEPRFGVADCMWCALVLEWIE